MDTQIFNKVDGETPPATNDKTERIPDLSSINAKDEPIKINDSDDKPKVKKSKKKKALKKDSASSFITELFDWASSFIFALVLVILTLTFCIRLVDVDGDSMLQTLQDKNKLIVTGLNYEPQVGDIVVISHGSSLDKTLVKRVIAVSGQTVDINSETGDVMVDGIVIKEDYINGKTTTTGDVTFPIEVTENTVFVLGDNRPISKDSRFSEVGLIDNDAIIGKVQLRIFPFDEIGKVD